MIRMFTMKLFKKGKWMVVLTGLLFLIGLNAVDGAVSNKEKYEEYKNKVFKFQPRFIERGSVAAINTLSDT